MGAFFEDGAEGTHKRPAPLAQSDKLRSNPWPYSTQASLSLCGDIGQKEMGQAQDLPDQEVWGVGHGKLAALEGPRNQISTLVNLLFGGQVPDPHKSMSWDRRLG